MDNHFKDPETILMEDDPATKNKKRTLEYMNAKEMDYKFKSKLEINSLTLHLSLSLGVEPGLSIEMWAERWVVWHGIFIWRTEPRLTPPGAAHAT